MGLDKEFDMMAWAQIAGKLLKAGDLMSKLVADSVPSNDILERCLPPGMGATGYAINAANAVKHITKLLIEREEY